MSIRMRLMTAVIGAGSLLSVATANAQWVMVAKAVSGQVQQLSHKPANGPGYDVATVVLEAPADKVYSTALNGLKTHQGITVTKSDDKKRRIEFTNGTQEATLQAQPLGGDKLSQLIIASNLTQTGPTATSLVLQGVLKVCAEMKVACSVEGD